MASAAGSGRASRICLRRPVLWARSQKLEVFQGLGVRGKVCCWDWHQQRALASYAACDGPLKGA